MEENKCDIGMIGLGEMGRNLLLNMDDKGFHVAGYDKDPARIQSLKNQSADRKIAAARDIAEFAGMLRPPRIAMMLVPAGPPVDDVIRDLVPHLSREDMIIDGGNSFFRDTELRARALEQKGIAYIGAGISGGGYGARYGPSIMPGGPEHAYERVRAVFEAIAAHVDGEPCVAYLGSGSAGHFVKMVHNGIEYGIMQLISEAYDLMKRGLGMNPDELHEAFRRWSESELNSYLIEITARIFRQKDEMTGGRLVDLILDKAAQKGTGKWTSQNAMDLNVPIPGVDIAVAMRDLSAMKEEREHAGSIFPRPFKRIAGDRNAVLSRLKNGLYAAMITVYAQGMSHLRAASKAYGYGLKLEVITRIWRGGCIIRSALLDHILSAFLTDPDIPNIMTDPGLSREIKKRQNDLRSIVCSAARSGIPAPGLMASLSYLDSYRSGWLPANLIQAQRDFFGAHTYERIDEEGVFHTQWS
ncbi:MAG: NADP-dependent phosphogluconate dehydrogenase [Syntrophales bacterium]